MVIHGIQPITACERDGFLAVCRDRELKTDAIINAVKGETVASPAASTALTSPGRCQEQERAENGLETMLAHLPSSPPRVASAAGVPPTAQAVAAKVRA
ncbi:hypothetical protein [Streptomyces sp. NTH33]|uniref:hypothetical protein n=1 Tax=Streptomyces sp. NTH33 TaxID=1735453 RepID=UPI0011B94C0C|nr:hypothetical protein [Streptomyces sp. NTH33]